MGGKEVVELEDIDARLTDESRGRENSTDGTVLPRIVLVRRSTARIVVVVMVQIPPIIRRLRRERLKQRARGPTETKPQRPAVCKRRRHETGRNDEAARECQIGDVEQWVARAQFHKASLYG